MRKYFLGGAGIFFCTFLLYFFLQRKILCQETKSFVTTSRKHFFGSEIISVGERIMSRTAGSSGISVPW